MLVGFLLLSKDQMDAEWAIALAIMVNVNVLLFNGIGGVGLGFHRALGGVLDVAFCVALLNCATTCLILLRVYRQMAPVEAAAHTVVKDFKPVETLLPVVRTTGPNQFDPLI